MATKSKFLPPSKMDQQQALVDLGFDLGKGGKNKNGVDGSFGSLSNASKDSFVAMMGLEDESDANKTRALMQAAKQAREDAIKYSKNGIEISTKDAFEVRLKCKTDDLDFKEEMAKKIDDQLDMVYK